MNPLITIITPLHNHEKYIGTCIQSVLNQRLTNWEQIVVDDASTDNSLEIARSFAKKDKRIKVIHHKNNWGIKKLANNYNQALKYAKGKYIAILESDDYWPSDKLEKQVVLMIKKDAVLSYGDCILVSSGGVPINLFTYKYPNNLLNNSPVGSINKLFANLQFSIIPVTVIIRKKELIEVGGFSKDKYYPFTDIPTFLKLTLKGKFIFINEILGYYRKQNISEWFNYASATDAMGRSELRNCVNTFVQNHSENTACLKISKDKQILTNQTNFIERKKRTKIISNILNKSAFKFDFNPLFFIFCFKLLTYKIKKLI